LFGKVLNQQVKMIPLWKKILIISAGIMILLSLTLLTELQNASDPVPTLYSNSFDRFKMWMIYFPISIGTWLAIGANRIGDIYRVQTRKVFVYQTLIQIIGIQTFIWLIWIVGNFIVEMSLGFQNVIFGTIGRYGLVNLYILIDAIILASVAACFWYFTDNKLMAFLGAMLVNAFALVMNINHLPSILYYFVRPASLMGLGIRIVIMLGIVLLLTAVTMLVINRKEF
jgi:hypothetical protein